MSGLKSLAGETHIAVRCMVRDTYPDVCSGWAKSFDLDDPAYLDGYGKIHFPGLTLECGECGQMHEFEVNEVGVIFP